MCIFSLDNITLLLCMTVPKRLIVLAKGLDLGFRRLDGSLELRVLRGLRLDLPANLCKLVLRR